MNTLFWNGVLFLLVVVVFVLYQCFGEERIKKKWARVIATTLIALVLMPLGGILLGQITGYGDKVETQNYRRIMLDGVVKGALSPEDIQSVLDQAYRKVLVNAEKNIDQWAEKFPERIKSKKKVIEGALLQEAEIADKFNMKWQPFVVQFFMKQIDTGIHAYSREKSIKQESKILFEDDNKIVYVQREPYLPIVLRKVRLPSGWGVEVVMYPGNVVNGNLVRPLIIQVNHITPQNSTTPAFLVQLNEKSAQANAVDGTYASLMERVSTQDDPLLNDEFTESITKAISNFFDLIYIKDDLATGQ